MGEKERCIPLYLQREAVLTHAQAAELVNPKLAKLKEQQGVRASMVIGEKKAPMGLGRGRGAPMMGALVQQMRDRQTSGRGKEPATNPKSSPKPAPAGRGRGLPPGRGRGIGGKPAPPVAPRRDLAKSRPTATPAAAPAPAVTTPAIAPVTPATPAPVMAPAVVGPPAAEPTGMTLEDLKAVLDVERRARDALEEQVESLMSRMAALEAKLA